MWQAESQNPGASTRIEAQRNTQPTSEKPIGLWWRSGWRALGRGMGWMGRGVANFWRRLRHRKIPDYVVIHLDQAVSERAPDAPWWYAYLPWIKLPLSLEYLHAALDRIVDDPDVRGVIFLVKGPSLSLPKAQSLAQMLNRFRAGDAGPEASGGATPKQVIVHLEDPGAAALVLAAAADKVLMTPLSSWNFAGLRVAPLYLKETLARIGLEFDVVRIAPWKSAFENWQRSRMSPESRDQNTWLLDSLFEDIVGAIAQGRSLAPEVVREHVDRAPLVAEDACAAGLIDGVLYEDELPAWLAPSDSDGANEEGKPRSEAGAPRARLARYAQVRGLLYRRARARAARSVGVMTLEGAIVPGESRRFPVPLPLLGDKLIGSRTVANQVRAARKNSRLAAVVLHVDSGGGSALASDLIWRELQLLAQEKPLVVYMGDVAASGGYYIATPGRKIVAQSATLTGSIGVVAGKLVTGEATARVGANREVIQRGANADLNAEDAPWNPAQRAKMDENIQHVYAAFKARVSDGRKLPLEGLDAIAHGRVWTGKQALSHGLVDAVGDFRTALDLACAEANLPQDGSVRTVNIPPARSRHLAQPAASAASAVELLTAALSGEWQAILGQDRFWFWADGLPRLRE
jgi:protease IV